MQTIGFMALALVGGYVAAIFTWSKVRTWLDGAEVEAMNLRQRAKDLEAKIRGAL